jgi:hypothetical protein
MSLLKMRMLFVCLAALPAACTSEPRPAAATVPGDPSAPSQVTPMEALAMARRYASHPWRPFARNVLHGADAAGIEVHTPDAGHQPGSERRGWWLPGEVNEGMPYKWGGFDDPDSFDEAVAGGLAAGDVSSPAKRRADNAGVSAHAAGVDCSGFVSRCLKLPRAHDTSQLPSVCNPLPSARDLRPGDLLNIPRGHVLLCAGWARPDKSWIYFYDTGGAPDYWRPGLKEAPLAALLELGYQPLRYKGMAYERATSGKEVLTRSAISRAVSVPEPEIGEP